MHCIGAEEPKKREIKKTTLNEAKTLRLRLQFSNDL